MAGKPPRDPQHSVWSDSTHPTSSLGFTPTQSSEADVSLQPLFDPERVFDVCHVGLVLRAVLGVQGLLALGIALAARDVLQWTQDVASGTLVTMFGDCPFISYWAKRRI